MKAIIRFCVLIIMVFLVAACDFNAVFDQSENIEENTWKWENDVVFEAEILDTLNTFDIYFLLRNDNDYPLTNMYVFFTFESPEGNIRKDTMNFYLADPAGKWYGKRFAGTYEHEIPIYSQVRMPVAGTYIITISQGTRIEYLKGIHDIGLRIEKH